MQSGNMTSFFRAFKQRQILKSTIAYLVVAWLIIQVLAILLPVFEISTNTLRISIIILAIGLPIWIVLNWFYSVSSDGLVNSESLEYNSDQFEKKKITLNRVIISGLTLAVVLLVFNTIRLENKIIKDDNVGASIAVLAFADMSKESNQEYFSEGISAELTSQLAKIKELKVIDRRSSFSYKGKNIKATQIGNELNVSHILDGNVRIDGRKIRIDVQLIDVSDGSHLWLETYDRNLDDIFKIQNEIADEIINQLKIVLGSSDKSKIESRPTNNLEAYKLYLEGLYFKNLSRVEHIEKAIKYFEQAIELDQDFALAKALLSQAYVVHNVFIEFNEEWERKAFVAFEEALFLDPNLAEAYVARGQWYWTPKNNFNHEQALQDFQKAIELNSGLSSAYESLMLVQLHVGLFEKALENGMKGIEIDPTNVWIQHFLSEIYFFQGNYSEAQKMNDIIGDKFDSPFRTSMKSQLLLFQGKLDQARQMLDQELVNYPEEPYLHSAYAILSAGLGENNEARKRIDIAIENKQSLRHLHHLYHSLAGATAIMGEYKEATSWLIKAAENGLPNYSLFTKDPNLSDLQGIHEFDDLMNKLKSKLDFYNSL